MTWVVIGLRKNSNRSMNAVMLGRTNVIIRSMVKIAVISRS